MTEKGKECLGIIAGEGGLPWIAARNAQEAGKDIRIFYAGNSEVPEEFRSLSEDVVITRFYSSLLPALKKHKVKKVILLGKLTRDLLYKKGYDLRLMLQLLRSRSQSDYSIFLIGEALLKKNGVEILPQTLFLSGLSLEEGRYGKKLNSRQLKDVIFSLQHARVINQMNIGQTVVVGDRAVLAVEAAEGTDSCIERGGKAFSKKGKGAVVCKLPSRDHDLRNDIPTIGLETLETMGRSDCRVIAFDAKHTFVVEPEDFLEKAKQYSISILAMNSEQREEGYLENLNAKSSSYSPRESEAGKETSHSQKESGLLENSSGESG